MNLQVRNPRARALAVEIARARGMSISDAVVNALQKDAAALPSRRRPTAEIAAEIRAELEAMGNPGGRDWTREERDDMMGGL